MTPEQAAEIIVLLKSIKFLTMIIVFALGAITGTVIAIGINIRDRE